MYIFIKRNHKYSPCLQNFYSEFVSCGIELFSLGQTAVATSFHHELILSFSCAVTATALLLLGILQYGFIPWLVGAPLAVLNCNNFWPNSIAEFTL